MRMKLPSALHIRLVQKIALRSCNVICAIEVGSLVRISGLGSHPEFNGSFGRVNNDSTVTRQRVSFIGNNTRTGSAGHLFRGYSCLETQRVLHIVLIIRSRGRCARIARARSSSLPLAALLTRCHAGREEQLRCGARAFVLLHATCQLHAGEGACAVGQASCCVRCCKATMCWGLLVETNEYSVHADCLA
jgi:hypothetical protein